MHAPLDKCPICTSDRIVALWNARDTQEVNWRYDRCSNCGDIFLNPPLEDAEVEQVYGEDYYGPDHNRFGGNVETTLKIFRNARANRAEKLMPPGGSVLDVGCGRGVFLEILARRGYKVTGTEISETAGKDAAKRVEVKVGELENIGFTRESFDLVTFWQVLEHLPDPKGAVAEASRLVKPGGKMLIQVPNPESIQARLGRDKWFHLDPPRHMHLMPLKCVDMVAAETGFTRVKHTTLNLEFSPFGILQTFQNLMGIKRDKLYETMMASKKEAGQTVLTAVSALLAPVAGFLSLLEWSVGAGGVIEAVYVKEG